MFILSQNGKINVKVENIAVLELIDTIVEEGKEVPSKDKFSIAIMTTAGNSFFVGTFKTKEKAEIILTEIRVWCQRREDVMYNGYPRATSISNTYKIPKEEE